MGKQPNPPSSLNQEFADRLIRWRLPLFLLAVVLAVAAFPASRQLEFDRSVENLFAKDDPLLAPYRKLARTFGGNEIVLAVYTGDVFAPDGSGLRQLAETSRDLAAVPGVSAVLSIDQPIGEEILDPDDPRAARLRALFQGYTHSANGRVVGIVCLLAPKEKTDVPREVTIGGLREVIHRRPEGMLAGVPVMIHDGFDYIEADGTRLGWSSSILLALVIILNFRSIRWVIVPIAVVQWALLMTRAALAWSDMRLSMVSSMLTAIITVVGVATVVHIIVRYREGRFEALAPRAALAWAGALLTAPIFWSCATDAAGFGSLLTAGVSPVRDFGLMMAVGVLLVMVAAALLVPLLALTGRRGGGEPRRAWGEGVLERQLGRAVQFVRRWPRSIGITAAISTAVAAAGVYRLEVETDFTKNFRADSPIAESYRFVESRLGGVGMWDILLPAPEQLDWEYLMRVERLEARLRQEAVVPGKDGKPVAGLTKVLSLADMILAAAPLDLASVRSSVLRNAMLSAGMGLFEKKMPAAIELLYGQDPKHPGKYYFRILLRSPERQPSAQKLALIDQVRRITREQFPPTAQSQGAQVTGMFVLLTHLVHSIIRDQWITFIVATAGITLMMIVAFRSVPLAVAAMVPNLAPILVVMGLMGWAGLKINLGAAMIAAVSIGLSIDSSVHYIISFQRARRQGKSVREAIDLVQQSVGRAVVFATVALIVGFLSLVTSQFIPTVYFGVLVSLTMLGGLLGNLLVLPLLLSLLLEARGNR